MSAITCATSLNFEVQTTPKKTKKNKLPLINKMMSQA